MKRALLFAVLLTIGYWARSIQYPDYCPKCGHKMHQSK
jgi:hypothetical protein